MKTVAVSKLILLNHYKSSPVLLPECTGMITFNIGHDAVSRGQCFHPLFLNGTASQYRELPTVSCSTNVYRCLPYIA